MIEYIKRLRICIRWYMELEDGYMEEQAKLRNMLGSEEKRHGELGIYQCFCLTWQNEFKITFLVQIYDLPCAFFMLET